MNAGRFRLVFSLHPGVFVPVVEDVVSHGRKSLGKRLRARCQAFAATMLGLAFTYPVFAAGPLAATALPTDGAITSGSGTITTTGNVMTVKQLADKMIVNYGTATQGGNSCAAHVLN